MRAAQVVSLTGPRDVVVRDVDTPVCHAGQVLVEVRVVGLSFPDVLMSKGLYQLRPDTPFTIGMDFSGVVVEGNGHVQAGCPVAGVLPHGAAAQQISIDADHVLPLPDGISLETGAALPMNYLTALFALAERAHVRPGETVVVNGAAGGVGTAVIQVARGLGLRTVAVVSTPQKADVARDAGADQTVLLDGFKEAVLELTAGRGADVVVDVLGGDTFTDFLRVLTPLGRLMVVGFASGQAVPEVRVNRLLLGNIDVRVVGWGAYVAHAGSVYMQRQWEQLLLMLRDGTVRPVLGTAHDLTAVSEALVEIAERRATGKVLLRMP